MSVILLESLHAWWPEALLSLGALVVLVAGACDKRSHAAHALTALTLCAAGWALWHTPVPPAASPFYGLILCDAFSLAFRWIALGVTALVALLIMGSAESPSHRGEWCALLLLIGVGLMLMAEANHLLIAYVAMELVSLSSYALVGFLDDRRSAEGALKYLMFGAMASGVMLFGMSLLYGLTGTLAFEDLLRSTTGLGQPMMGALSVAVALMLVGVAFKISMVPFHLWTPDAYEAAPVAVTALLSVGPKAAGLALLLRLLQALSPAWPAIAPLVLALTILTMTLGNVAALVQTNIKRLLAYSTIGQVGYLLIGVVARNAMGLEGIMTYLVAYAFMNLGAFACVIAVVDATGSESLESFRGLSQRAPILAACCAVFLLSLAGIPPFIGFMGKFLLFGSAIEAGQIGLALVGIVNSAIALYYYVNIIRLMYAAAPAEASPLPFGRPVQVAVGVCAAVTVIVGLFPGPLLAAIRASAHVNLL